ncbi:MAG: zf-HC2 domain-containing protein [Pirellulaceae bacterium]|nr:zf-HC2 domain-containing protein [Pirellulaceae bacterium]
MNSPEQCPTLKHLAKYANGTLSDEALEIMQLHIESCDECQDVIQTLRDASGATNRAQPNLGDLPSNVPMPNAEQSGWVESESVPAKGLVPAVRVKATPVPGALEQSEQHADIGKNETDGKSFGMGRVLVLATILGIWGAAGYLGWNKFVRPYLSQKNDLSSGGLPNAATSSVGDPASGFRITEFDRDTPIETIRISIRTGEQAAPLQEPLDVHLGFGFPLRLLEVSDLSGFAAVPQRSSLRAGSSELAPGGDAWFEFAVAPKNFGDDKLRKTPQLLAGLKLKDICKIGFASQGKSDWELAGYTIEVNGKPFASNDAVKVRPQTALASDQQTLADLLPIHEVLARRLEEYKTLDSAGYLDGSARTDWETAKQEFEKLTEPLLSAGGKLMGQIPWYLEQTTALDSYDKYSAPRSVDVTLVTSPLDQSGTLNTVYFSAGGHKYALSSSTNPLKNGPELNQFHISADDLSRDPLDLSDLKTFGIGVIGGSHLFGKIPDRLRLDRVLVKVDGKTTYDSDMVVSDRQSLGQIDLIPMAHLDEDGNIVQNVMHSELERSVWMSGDKLATIPSMLVSASATGGEPSQQPTAVQAESPRQAEPEPFQTQLLGPPIAFNAAPIPVSPSELSPSELGQTAMSPSMPSQSAAIAPINLGPPLGTTPPFISRSVNNQTVLDELIPLLNGLLKSHRARRGSPTSSVAPAAAPPGKPQISSVQLDPLQSESVRDSQSVVIRWKEENASSVAAYEVRLNAVLPHVDPTKKVLLVSTQVQRLAKLESALLPAIDLSKPASGLKPEDLLHVFLEPEVVAIGSDGKPLGNGLTATGPLVPVHHKDWTAADFRLATGPDPKLDTSGWIQLQDAASITPGFQFGGDGYGHSGSAANRWLPFARPAQGEMGAWLISDSNQFATCGLQFCKYPTSVALRNVGEHISLRFDSQPIDYVKSLRLTGLLGFIDGDAASSNSAEFRLRVIVQRIPPGGSAVAIQEPTAGSINDNELLRIGTTTSVTFEKTNNGVPRPMQLIDIPIPFASSASPASSSPLPLEVIMSKQPTASARAVVSLTIMANQTSAQGADALALFGLRLVPDNPSP